MSRLGHRAQDQLDVLERVAEALLVVQERGSPVLAVGQARRHDLAEEARDGDVVLHHPAAVGTAPGVEGLELGVLHETVVHEVEPEDRAGFEAAVARDVLGGDVEHAGFGGEDEEPVAGQRPAGGTEAVAVERRAEADAVREGDGGGAVPRLHQRGVVFVEPAHVVAHVVFRAPGLRDEHHHRMRRGASGRDQQFEHVVERGGVGLALVDDRKQFLDVVAEDGRGERRLARGERVEVALEGVDLAVVRDGAEGVCELPRGEGVRGVALVDDGEGRNEVGIGEVGVELFDLGRQEQSLVHDRARRAGADVGLRRGFLDQPPDDIEFVLEIACGAGGNEDLADPRHHGAGVMPDGARIGRDVAPGDHFAAFAPDGSLDLHLFSLAAEDHRDAEIWGAAILAAVVPLAAKMAAFHIFPHDLSEERVRNLQQKAGAVARLGVVACRAAVHQALQDRQAVRHDLMAGLAREVGHHPDAACVMFIFAPVQPALSIVFALLVHDSVPSQGQ